MRWLGRGAPALVALGFAVLLTAVFVVVPHVLVRGHSHLTAAQRLKAENDVRTAGIQLLAGLFVAGGLYFTARTYRLSF
jgi:hypothetical protein